MSYGEGVEHGDGVTVFGFGRLAIAVDDGCRLVRVSVMNESAKLTHALSGQETQRAAEKLAHYQMLRRRRRGVTARVASALQSPSPAPQLAR